MLYVRSAMLDQITPIVLTYNEAPNIRRTLDSLRWAERVVVVDSGSKDGTKEIAKSFSNVVWYIRNFDSFKSQCEYAIHHTGIMTRYVLALDADMIVSSELASEIGSKFLAGSFNGGLLRFEFRLSDRPLAGSLYPAQVRLFRRDRVRVLQMGHAHTFDVDGPVYRFKQPLIHDDRKPLERWVASQLSYSALEAQRIASRDSYRFRDRLRELGVMPVIAGALAYIRAGGPFRGAAAVRYAYERAAYESLLAIRLMSLKLEAKQKTTTEAVPLQTKKLTDRDAK
jgi:glycosyltransferase involved in cell wall biosynthesis